MAEQPPVVGMAGGPTPRPGPEGVPVVGMAGYPKQLPARCRSCGQPIRWATTRLAGQRMPLDAEPDPAGQWAIVDGDGLAYELDRALLALGVGDAVVAHVDGGARWMAHWGTCPQAGQWRKRR